MLMEHFTFIVIYFSIFSFLGWVVESGYRSFILEKKLINSGFLYGPFIPIYGFGAGFIFLTWLYIREFPIYIQITIYTILATFLEYIASFLLEKIFSVKLWDYSHEKFNFNGRICLKFVLFWAILITLNLLFIQPFFVKVVKMIHPHVRFYVTVVLLIYFAIDTFLSSKIFFTFVFALDSLRQFIRNGIKFQSPELMQKIKWQLETKHFLRAIKLFPNLALLWNKNWELFSEKGVPMAMSWISNYVKSKTGKKWISTSYEYNVEFRELIFEIEKHPIYQELKKYHHHEHSIYEHAMRVAWLSFKLGKVLNLNIKELVKGALLHDFFLYDWRTEKPESGKLHAFEHPVEALRNAEKYFAPITKIEKDIILRHMWPLTIMPPRHLESFVVCLVDKIVATKEFSVEFANNSKLNKQKKLENLEKLENTSRKD
jgi:uncharacterized membrane protein/HD superfamily phosphodiesterase